MREYLEEFAASQTRPTQASQSGLVKQPISTLQSILHKVGWTKTAANSDGKYGSTSQKQWQQSTMKRKLNPAFDRASATEAWVHPKTLNTMAGRVVATTAAPAKQTTTQRAAWQKRLDEQKATEAAQRRPDTSAATGGRLAPFTVMPRATPAPSEPRAPAPKPAPRPVVRPRPKAVAIAGLVTVSVLELQKILHGLGWRTTTVVADGKYGSKTAGAWASSAKLRKVSGVFERKSATTAAVVPATLARFKADVAGRAKTQGKAPGQAPAPAPAKLPAAAAGTVVKTVAETQALLHGNGWKKTAANSDGKYGPTSKSQWQRSAATRKLPGTYDRVSSTTVKVAQSTFAKIQADAQARGTAPVRPKTVRTPAPGPAPEPKSGASPTTQLTVLAVQQGLNGKGVKPMLDTDGAWGTRTHNALSAWLKAQPGGANSTFLVSSGKRNVTLPTAFAGSLRASAANAPAPPGRADIAVSAVKRALGSLGTYKVGGGATLDATTAKALEAFIQNIDHGVNTGYRVSKDRKTVLNIRKNIADRLRSLASDKPPAPDATVIPEDKPKPTPTGGGEVDPILRGAEAISKISTEPVPVLWLQEFITTTARYPQVKLTGVWDAPTRGAFLDLFQVPEAVRPYYERAFPLLLSSDNKTLRLKPTPGAEVVKKGHEIFKAREALSAQQRAAAQERADVEAKQRAESAAEEEARRQEAARQASNEPQMQPSDGAGWQRSQPQPQPQPQQPTDDWRGEPTLPSGPTSEPMPQEMPPAQLAAGEQTFAGLVEALSSIGLMGPVYTKAVADAAAAGKLTDAGKLAYANWVKSAQRIMARAAQIIEQSPNLQKAIDTGGPSAGLGRYGSLDGYGASLLGDLASASSTAVGILREEFPIVMASGQPLGGLANPLVPVVIRGAAMLGRFAGPAWRGLLAVLNTKAVTVIGGAAMAGSAIDDVVNGETRAYLEHNEKIAQMQADGTLTGEEAGEHTLAPPKQGSMVLPLVGGAVLLGGMAIYLKNR